MCTCCCSLIYLPTYSSRTEHTFSANLLPPTQTHIHICSLFNLNKCLIHALQVSQTLTDSNAFTQLKVVFIRKVLQPSSSELLHTELIHNTGSFWVAIDQNVINMYSCLISYTTGWMLQWEIDCYLVESIPTGILPVPDKM